jgi:riboflavin biosynthesis pyrimidine reductase
VYANFVSTLDGVVTLGAPGHQGGGDISGNNPSDAMIMGILRAVSDAVIISAGSLRVSPKHLWTAESIYPSLAKAYGELRLRLGLPEHNLHVIATSSGVIDFHLPLFSTENHIPILIVTTNAGQNRINTAGVPDRIQVQSVKESGWLSAEDVLQALSQVMKARRVLVEAGPHLTGVFLKDRRLDALFLSFAPQVAGRNGTWERLGLIAGQIFAPGDPRWAELISVKEAGDFLFFRYEFNNKG